MTMLFRTVKDSIVNNVLGPAEAGRFQTIGYQRQAKAASEALDSLRMVQVYYFSGEFSKRGGRPTGPVQHDITYRIDLTVSKSARGDLAVINNPASTPNQIATAMMAFQEASDLADQSYDELFDIVYQILMDGRNVDVGLDKGVVANRWIPDAQKDQPIPKGEFVVITGYIIFQLRVAEQVPGDVGVPYGSFNTTINIDGDDVQKTGVAGDLGG